MNQKESFKRLIQLTLAGVCILLQTLVYRYIWYYYISWEMKSRIGLGFWNRGNTLLILLYAVLMLAFMQMYGGLKIGYYRITDTIFSQYFASVFVDVITFVQLSLMMVQLVNIFYLLTMLAADFAIVVVWNIIAGFIYRAIFSPRQMLLIHGDRPFDDIIQKFNTRKDRYDVCKTISYREGYERLYDEILQRYDAVVLWDIPVDVRNKIIKYCYGKSIRVYIMPKITDVLLKGADQMNLFDTPILLIREYNLTMEERFIKRTADIICSLILIVLTSPFMVLTALLVKLYDGGPVLYKQTRVTENNREFTIMKFRSMRVDAEKDGVARLASKGDSRITPIGKFIRKVRLDELPQLFNILVGDMTFIGPRPERPEIIKQYMEMMPEFAFRTKVKAGLAGYAQVYGKYNTTPYDKLKLDLYYIENYSFWLDVQLALLTLKILLTPDSTEGIESSQITAMRESNEQLKIKKEKLDREARERVEREQKERGLLQKIKDSTETNEEDKEEL